MTKRHLSMLLGLALLAGSNSAFAINSDGTMTGTWRRPNEDLMSVAPGEVGYGSLGIWVDTSGVYTLSSEHFYFDGFLAVYADHFDPLRPLDGLVAANDDGPSGPDTSRLELQLVEGVIYHLVVSGARPGERGEYRTSVSGPGQARRAACFIGDEPFFNDEVPLGAQSFRDGLFCVSVSWRDFIDQRGIGKAIGKRSDESGLFWFFSRANWELMVKVLDGCAVNGHYWVFMAATTNVEFDVEVIDFHDFASRRYHNALGVAAPAVTDTRAFACR